MAYLTNGDSNFATDVYARSEKVARQIIDGIFWKNMIGDVQFGKDENQMITGVAPTGMPIERMTNFTMGEGQTSALLPYLEKLTPSPKYGDTKLIGTGVSLNYKWLEVFVNATRQAVIGKEGVMSDFRMAYLGNVTKAQEELRDLFTRLKNSHITAAIYEGASPNVTEGLSTAKNGIGLKKRLHPNSYYIAATDSTGATLTELGTAGYTKTAANYDTAATGVSTTAKFTYKTMTSLASLCREKKIPKIITSKGESFWLLILHSEQLKDLKADSDFLANERAAISGGEIKQNNPIFADCETFCSEFAIYTNNTVVRCWTAATDTFGNYWEETPTTSANFCAIVLGKSAVGYADPMQFKMTTEDYDHESVLEFGGTMIDGANRYDYIAESDRATAFSKGNSSAAFCSAVAATNQSSLILMSA